MEKAKNQFPGLDGRKARPTASPARDIARLARRGA